MICFKKFLIKLLWIIGVLSNAALCNGALVLNNADIQQYANGDVPTLPTVTNGELFYWFKADGSLTNSSGSKASAGDHVWRWVNQAPEIGDATSGGHNAACTANNIADLLTTNGPNNFLTVATLENSLSALAAQWTSCPQYSTTTNLDITSFMVVRQTNATGFQAVFSAQEDGLGVDYVNSGTQVGFNGAGSPTSAAFVPLIYSVTNWTIVTYRHVAGQYGWVRTNGVSVGRANTPFFYGLFNSPTVWIGHGQYPNTLSLNWEGYVSELIIYGSSPSAGNYPTTNDIQAVEHYLDAKWGTGYGL